MKDKILIELTVPVIGEVYEVFIPISKKIGNVIILLNKALNDLTNGVFVISDKIFLYNKVTGERYNVNSFVRGTDIKNGTRLVLY